MFISKAIKTENKKGLMLVLFTALVSGFSIFINGYAVKEFDSSIFAFAKNALVAVSLLCVLWGFGMLPELRGLSKKNWIQLIVIGLIGGSIPFLLFFKGLQMTSGTTSAFLHKTIFLYAGVFAIVMLKERISKGFIIGGLLILAGNYLMIQPQFKLSAGHLFVILATIMWGAENTYAKHVLKDISGTIVAFGRMFFGSVFILVFLILTGKIVLLTSLSPQNYIWIILSSGLLLMYVLSFYNCLSTIKVTTATSVLTLGAPLTTLLNFVFRGTQLSLTQGIGMLSIILGIASVIWFAYLSEIFAVPKEVRIHGRV